MSEKNVEVNEQENLPVLAGHERQIDAATGEIIYQSLTLVEEFQKGSTDFITGLPADDSPLSKAMLYQAINSNNGSVDELINKDIDLANFMIYPAHMLDQQGQVVPIKRSVLILEDGTTYGCSAEGVFNSLSKIVAMMGMPDQWAGTLPVKIRKQKTRQGFQTTLIDIDITRMGAPKKGGK